MDGEAERWDRRSPGGAMGSREDRADGKSVRSHLSLSVSARLWSPLHLFASFFPFLNKSSLCAAQTLLLLKCSNLQPPSAWIHIAEADRPVGDDFKSSI